MGCVLSFLAILASVALVVIVLFTIAAFITEPTFRQDVYNKLFPSKADDELKHNPLDD